MLEQEFGLFFEMTYFEGKVLDGDRDEIEKYLKGFTKVDENRFSIEMFFEIRKQKYLKALDRSNQGKAVEILYAELKEFSKLNQDMYNELTTLLTLNNFRENEHLSNYGDDKSARNLLMLGLKRLIAVNPIFKNKLMFPLFKESRLQTLINQSLNWQHHFCKNPMVNPDIKTLLTDHTCSSSNGSATPTPQRAHDGAPEETITLKERAYPVQCRTLTMPQESVTPTNKVVCLYTKSGDNLLALGSDGIHKIWKWSINELNPSGKAAARVVPQNWRPNTNTLVIDDVPKNSKLAVPCVILSNNDSYIIFTCGGRVSVYDLFQKFKEIGTSLPPPPTSTSLAFHPRDNNIVAIGRDNLEILIYYFKYSKIMHILKGHRKNITGLAFSSQLNILVSSGADAQLFFWSIDTWERKNSLALQMAAENVYVSDTTVKFHINQVTLLVCHATQLAIYDASKLKLICQWMPQDGLSGLVSSATFSCNGQLVYASFTDGHIGVFDSDNLKPRCCIPSSTYLHQISPSSKNVYPLVVAAHPQEANQFAVGLSDGSIKVVEPIESDGGWGIKAPVGTV